MEENRRASQQIAYRVEPEVYAPWDEYVEAGLIPGRCHHACAMLLYLWVRPEVREAMQQSFAKFVRENVMDVPTLPIGSHAVPIDGRDEQGQVADDGMEETGRAVEVVVLHDAETHNAFADTRAAGVAHQKIKYRYAAQRRPK